MLKFKVDENLPAEVAELLSAAGYDALTVPQQHMGGHPDPGVADACRHESRAVITLDLDFCDIRAYPPADYSGIIVLRLSRLDKHRVLSAVRRLLPTIEQEPLADCRRSDGSHSRLTPRRPPATRSTSTNRSQGGRRFAAGTANSAAASAQD